MQIIIDKLVSIISDINSSLRVAYRDYSYSELWGLFRSPEFVHEYLKSRYASLFAKTCESF